MKTAAQKAASRPGPGLGGGVLVGPGWLAGHLNDADLRVVEVDVSPAAYDDWHIDGARVEPQPLRGLEPDRQLPGMEDRLGRPAALGGSVPESGDSTRHLPHQPS